MQQSEFMEGRARLLFNLNIKFVEIEISSACNRRCAYCPQSFLQRGQELMPLELFTKILSELAGLDYKGDIAFHQYNEPLLAPEHLEACLEKTVSLLPACTTQLFTNGDLLTRRTIAALGARGLNRILISRHLQADETWRPDLALLKVLQFCQKLDIDTKELSPEHHYLETELDGVQVYVVCPDITGFGSSRLNTVKVNQEGRKQKLFCSQMMTYLNIAYSGTAYMCCDCCHGMPEARPYALGSAWDQSVLDLFKAKMPLMGSYLFGTPPEACQACFGQ